MLEETYEIFFDDQDVARENFRSVQVLADLVDGKRMGGLAPLRP